jgi:hypothetical protein
MKPTKKNVVDEAALRKGAIEMFENDLRRAKEIVQESFVDIGPVTPPLLVRRVFESGILDKSASKQAAFVQAVKTVQTMFPDVRAPHDVFDIFERIYDENDNVIQHTIEDMNEAARIARSEFPGSFDDIINPVTFVYDLLFAEDPDDDDDE